MNRIFMQISTKSLLQDALKNRKAKRTMIFLGSLVKTRKKKLRSNLSNFNCLTLQVLDKINLNKTL